MASILVIKHDSSSTLICKKWVFRQLDEIKKKKLFKCLVKCYLLVRGFDEDGGGGSTLIVNAKYSNK